MIKKRLYGLMTLLAIGLLSISSAYEALPGKGYAKVEPKVASITGTKDKVEVVSVFSYGCGFCYKLEPYIDQWATDNSDHVKFLRMPIPGEGMNEIFAKTYFSLVALNAVDKGHQAFFDAVMDRKRFTSAKAVAKLMAEHGIDEEAFLKAWDSFSVNTNVNRAMDLVVKYKITSTPSIIVNGEYFVDVTTANTHEPNRDEPYAQTIKVLDALVDEIIAEKANND